MHPHFRTQEKMTPRFTLLVLLPSDLLEKTAADEKLQRELQGDTQTGTLTSFLGLPHSELLGREVDLKSSSLARLSLGMLTARGEALRVHPVGVLCNGKLPAGERVCRPLQALEARSSQPLLEW